jgi:hypothetical protein
MELVAEVVVVEVADVVMQMQQVLETVVMEELVVMVLMVIVLYIFIHN